MARLSRLSREAADRPLFSVENFSLKSAAFRSAFICAESAPCIAVHIHDLVGLLGIAKQERAVMQASLETATLECIGIQALATAACLGSR